MGPFVDDCGNHQIDFIITKSKMYSFSVLCIVACFTMAYSIDLPECKKIECADYKVIETKKDYEIREYDLHKMASTQSSRGAFMKLFRFIQKGNDREEKIPMTAPVLQYYNVDSNTKEMESSGQKMSFFMTKNLGEDIPKPKNEEVKIDDFGPVTVYAVRFGGFMWRWKVLSYQKKLYNALIADGVEFDENTVVTAGYNSPWQIFGRHNDLFYMAKNKNSAQSQM